MIHPFLVLLIVYLAFISTAHAIAEDEDFDDMTAAIADSFAIVGGRSQRRRLQKRGDKAQASTKPEPMILQFDFGPSRFVIQLQEHPNIIHDSTVVRVHHENKSAISTKPVDGVAYIGERLVVIDKSLSDSKYGNNVTALLLLSEEPGVSVLEYPFGRFYVEDTPVQPRITGGFVFNDQFIRVNEASHPVSRQLATKLHMKLAKSPSTDNREPLVITSQNLADTRSFGTSRNTTRQYRCGHDHLDFNKKPEGATSFFARLLANNLTSGQDKKLYARSESGCPSTEKVLYVGVVADCAYMEAFKMDAAQAQANIINDFNIVSAIYEESFNVILGIISVDLMMECSKEKSKAAFNRPCSEKMRMDERLNLFTAWRGSQSSDAGLYHLVSGCSDSDIVGIAWLNQVCQAKPYIDPNGDAVAGTSVSVFIKNQFAIMAHEIGHNFGAPHDCDYETCKSCSGPDCKCCPCDKCDCKGQYVMNPESGGLNVKQFSACSIQDVCKKIPVLAPCLKEPGTFKTLTKAMCGDGIRDEGEECDCGGPEKCRGNPCCTEDCKLKNGAFPLQQIRSASLPRVFAKNSRSAMDRAEIVQRSNLLLTAQNAMPRRENVHQEYVPVDHSNVQLWEPGLDCTKPAPMNLDLVALFARVEVAV
ncbi:hypothetical protein PSACC_02623 [Paramicrosporidium saccamoebae]|uniref:Zinc metalloprotease n=1 Tax=Paramicrosporidium saccamoebae TaxID=1246581 RepID=A0A2H9TIW7_9FUNG|nr:hypothetical protein PSACC_02623 [Paramicrosporidium saccamoebae]